MESGPRPGRRTERGSCWLDRGTSSRLPPTADHFAALPSGTRRGESWQPLNLRAGLDPVDVTGCATGAAVPDPEANPGLVTDCTTLLEVQHGLADGAGLNWSSDRPIHEWAGIALGGSPLRVHELRIDRPDVPRPALSGLHRPLPAALGRLPQLRVLSLIANQLTGPIPRDLGELTSLRELHLDANHLTGSIPPELAQLANLEVLILSQNELTGPIPGDLGHLTKLRDLRLAANGLSGADSARARRAEKPGASGYGGQPADGVDSARTGPVE